MAKYNNILVTCYSTAVYSLSQVVVDCTERMCHVETKFIGYPNDAQQFNLISRIGLDLPFSDQCVLLADKIYSNRFFYLLKCLNKTMGQQETMPTYKPSNSEVSHCHKRHVSDC